MTDVLRELVNSLLCIAQDSIDIFLREHAADSVLLFSMRRLSGLVVKLVEALALSDFIGPNRGGLEGAIGIGSFAAKTAEPIGESGASPDKGPSRI